MKVTLSAGKYFFGDVLGVQDAIGVPARAAVWYSDCGNFEIEIAGGGATCHEEDAVGMIGLFRIPAGDGYEYYDDVSFEMSEPFDAEISETFFKAGPVTVTVPEGFTFMNLPEIA